MRMEYEIDYIGIGKRVREKRLENKLTQEQLAERVCVSSSFVGHIERAEKVPSVETIMKISYALHTTLDYLVCGIKWRCDRDRCYLYDDMSLLMKSYGFEEKMGRS